jgi:hypothetical protein
VSGTTLTGVRTLPNRVAALLAAAAGVALFSFAGPAAPARLSADDDDATAQLQQQEAEKDMIEAEQQAEQQNEAAQQQMQLDDQLATS